MLASVVISSVLFFQMHPKGAAPAPVAATLRIMRERLHAADIEASTVSLDMNRVRVTFDSASTPFVSRLLTQTGNITCRIVPNGPTYQSRAWPPFRDGAATFDAGGQRIVTMRVADPSSFYRFTNANVNRDMGIFVDGKLLMKVRIHDSISQYTEIAGLSQAQAREIAAIIDSGPLPVRVTRIR